MKLNAPTGEDFGAARITVCDCLNALQNMDMVKHYKNRRDYFIVTPQNDWRPVELMAEIEKRFFRLNQFKTKGGAIMENQQELACKCGNTTTFKEITTTTWAVNGSGEREEKVNESTVFACSSCCQIIVR